MHFLPTTDQLELQQGVRELLADRFPLDRLSTGYDDGVWRALTDTGVFALRTDLGLGLAEAVLVFEELGRACMPGPLVATFISQGYASSPQISDTAVTVLDPDEQPLLLAHRDTSTAVLVLGDTPQLAAVPAGNLVPDLVDPLTPLH